VVVVRGGVGSTLKITPCHISAFAKSFEHSPHSLEMEEWYSVGGDYDPYKDANFMGTYYGSNAFFVLGPPPPLPIYGGDQVGDRYYDVFTDAIFLATTQGNNILIHVHGLTVLIPSGMRPFAQMLLDNGNPIMEIMDLARDYPTNHRIFYIKLVMGRVVSAL
jgi:hypothetical protein